MIRFNTLFALSFTAALSAVTASADPIKSLCNEPSGYSKITQTNKDTTYFWTGNAEANQPGCDYLAIHQTRTPVGGNATFVGNSFTIGDDTHAVTLADKSNGGTVTWNNMGLILCNGTWQGWDVLAKGKRSTFAGLVTVTAKATKPFGVYPTADAICNDYRFGLEGEFRSDADCGLYVSHNSVKWKTTAPQYTNQMDLLVTADTTSYYGELIAKTNGYITLAGSAFAGSVKVEGGGHVTFTNDCLEVGTLELGANADAVAYLKYDETKGDLVPLTFDTALRRDFNAQKIRVILPVSALTAITEEKTLTLVTTTGSDTLSLDDFSFEGLTDLPATTAVFFGAPELSADEKSIVLKTLAYVTLRAGDKSEYTSLDDISGKEHSTPTNWTNNTLPQPGLVYRVDGFQLRTSPTATADTTLDVFPGLALFFNRGTLSLKSAGLDCDDLTFYGGSIAGYGPQSTQTVRGKMTIRATSSAPKYTCLIAQLNRTLAIEADIYGNDQDAAIMIDRDGTAGYAPTISFSGDNRNYKGRVNVSGLNETTYAVWAVSDVKSLGGSPDTLDGESIMISNYGKMRVDDDIDFDIPNRYLYVNTTGRVGVVSGKCLRIATRMKLNGHLWKEDPGTLDLAGSIGFGSANSATPVDGVNNFINVKAGNLKVSHLTGVDGARITLAPDTTILVDVAPTGNRATYGFKNVRTEYPLQSTAADGKTTFALDLTKPLGGRVTVPLCTVTDTAAASLSDKITLRKPQRGFKTKLTTRDNGNNTVTFLAEVEPAGMAIIVY